MHKRMLTLSDRLAALPAVAQTDELRHLLYIAQANDAYWHGSFGGIYLPHLRRHAWTALLTLEAQLDKLAPRPPRGRWDMDADGIDELFIRNSELQAVLKLDGAASIVELDAYAFAHNFSDILRRHPEQYHYQASATQSVTPSEAATADDGAAGEAQSTPDDLTPDTFARTLLRDSWIDESGSEQPIQDYELGPYGPVERAVSFHSRGESIRADKHVLVQGNRVTVTWLLLHAPNGTFRTVLNLALPSCDGITGRYMLRGEILCGFGQPLDAPNVSEVVLDDRSLGGALTILASRAASLQCRPHVTVSRAADRLERIMQAATVSLSWPITAGMHEFSVVLKIDRSE
jgi:4-alpha-glucanotransferase